MEIYCCECKTKVAAILTTGKEIYPHREDLCGLPFWQCPNCKKYVGCHKNSKNKPLGNIPTKEIRNARQHIHALIDPLWKDGFITRDNFYNELSSKLGWGYHTANIRSIDEARQVYKIALDIKKRLLYSET